MPELFLNQRGQLCLSLRGAADDSILTTFRHWPHWRDVQIERDAKTRQCVAVTLTTDVTYEPTVRDPQAQLRTHIRRLSARASATYPPALLIDHRT